ncbi:MAG: transcriptional regulator with GAF, ATPase, and Fis domain/serine/threonine protein kinase [Planctomycetota bacterium]|jgi:transcriptional regulator with GAF, ATPase, and Fis domain/serine/threonine protein kinase/tetratricopeptide (TPR) repeat protein
MTDDSESPIPFDSMRFGRYQITRQLGAGGQGQAFLADDVIAGSQVVLKHALGNDTFIHDEYHLLARVDHSHVVCVHALYHEPKVAGVVLVEEFIEGEPLSDFLGKLRYDELLSIGIQVMSAVSHLHVIGLRHGDIKPANILIRRDGDHIHATLIDFGLASALTNNVYLGGTPDFVAPEILAGKGPSAACDWYALGHTLELMRAGDAADPENEKHPVTRVIANLKLADPRLRQEAVSWLVDAPGIADETLALPERLPELTDDENSGGFALALQSSLASDGVKVIEVGGKVDSGCSEFLALQVWSVKNQSIARAYRDHWFDPLETWKELAVDAGVDLGVATKRFEGKRRIENAEKPVDHIAVFLDLLTGLDVPVFLALGRKASESHQGRELIRRCELLAQVDVSFPFVLAVTSSNTSGPFRLDDWPSPKIEALLRVLFPRECRNAPEQLVLIAKRIHDVTQGQRGLIHRIVRASCSTRVLRRLGGGLSADLNAIGTAIDPVECTALVDLSAPAKTIVAALQQNANFLDRPLITQVTGLKDSVLDRALKELRQNGLICDQHDDRAPIKLLQENTPGFGSQSWSIEDELKRGSNALIALHKRFNHWLLSAFPESVSAHLRRFLRPALPWFPGRGPLSILCTKSYLQAGHPQDAIDFLDDLPAEVVEEIGVASRAFLKARILSTTGKNQEAIGVLESCPTEELSKDDHHLLCADRAYYHLLAGDVEAAANDFPESDLAGLDPETVGRCLTMMGLVARAQGQLDSATELFRLATKQWQELADDRRVAAALGNLALCDLDVANFNSAVTLMRSALQLLRRRGSSDQIASVVNNLGVALSRSRRFLDATREFGEAMRLFASCGDTIRVEMSRASRGISSLGAGEVTAAKRDLERAEEVLSDTASGPAIEKTKEALVSTNLLLGRYGRARRWLDHDDDPRQVLVQRFNEYLGDRHLISVGLRSAKVTDRLVAKLAAVELRFEDGKHDLASKHVRGLLIWRQRLEKEMNSREKTLFRAGVALPALRLLESRIRHRVGSAAGTPVILGVIADILSDLNRDASLRDILDGVVANVLDITRAIRVFVVRIPDDSTFDIIARAEKNGGAEGDPQLSTLVLKRCREAREPILIADASDDTDFGFAASVRAMGLRSIATFPLLETDDGYHVLYLDTPLESAAFTESDLTAVSILAEIASAAFSLSHRAQKSDLERRISVVSESRARRALQQQSGELQRVRRRSGFGEFIGSSASLATVQSQLKRAGQSELSILITGETGAGKELAAEKIHASSPRASNPFIALNAATLTENLAESELFGHEKGAFTGATTDSLGLLRSADGGTFFLDECGELSAAVQAKLLRVMENKTLRPVGGNTNYEIDVRFVFATNRKIKTDPGFRDDLYYRISQIEIELPPLRDRLEDIPLLVEHFLKLNNREDVVIEAAAMEALMEYSWPGNVRELRNVVDRLVLLSANKTARLTDLPQEIWDFRGSKPMTLAEAEIVAIRNALRWAAGEKKAAAKLLGISRTALYDKLKRYLLDVED